MEVDALLLTVRMAGTTTSWSRFLGPICLSALTSGAGFQARCRDLTHQHLGWLRSNLAPSSPSEAVELVFTLRSQEVPICVTMAV